MKKGEEEATQLQKNIQEGPIQNFGIAICTPNFDKFTPLLS